MKTENKRTRQECIDLLVGLYKRGIFDSNLSRTQAKFDDYVADFLRYQERPTDSITDEELVECAENALDHDGYEYLENLED